MFFSFSDFIFLLLLLPTRYAQLFLPSSPSPSHSSIKNKCDCPATADKGRQLHPQQQRELLELHRQKYFQQQQQHHHMNEAKRVKALVNALNGRRKLPKTETFEEKEMPEIPETKLVGADLNVVMKAMNETLLGALRGMEAKLAPAIEMASNSKKLKKTKAFANTASSQSKYDEKKKEGQKGEMKFRRLWRAKRAMFAEGANSLLVPADEPLSSLPNSNGLARCNSERIRRIIRKAKGRDSAAIKRNIQTVAERQFSAKFNVVCANDDFSYISNTKEFCQDQINGNTCYVFRQLDRNDQINSTEENFLSKGLKMDIRRKRE